MLGFNIQKLLFTVVVVMAVWYGFKWLGQMKIKRDRGRSRLRREAKRGSAHARKESSSRSEGDPDGAEDMVECSTCGAFVAARGATSCGRGDCPYPG